MSNADPSSEYEIIEIRTGQQRVSDLPRLDLGEYRAAVQRFRRPSRQQILDFASYVSEAKSWYKHLPLLPPGEPFHFFISPWAGLDRILLQDGRVVHMLRTEDTPQVHYTWMTSAEFMLRFGCLAFACKAATELLVPVRIPLDDGGEVHGFLDNNPSRASFRMTEDREYQLPAEVLAAGTIRLTGVIHPKAANTWVWLDHLEGEMQSESLAWPEETGGLEAWRKIVDLCHQRGATVEAGKELADLLAPERSRLLQEMALAMHRVVDLVYA
jgi:hypothetical protein